MVAAVVAKRTGVLFALALFAAVIADHPTSASDDAASAASAPSLGADGGGPRARIETCAG